MTSERFISVRAKGSNVIPMSKSQSKLQLTENVILNHFKSKKAILISCLTNQSVWLSSDLSLDIFIPFLAQTDYLAVKVKNFILILDQLVLQIRVRITLIILCQAVNSSLPLSFYVL